MLKQVFIFDEKKKIKIKFDFFDQFKKEMIKL